MNEDFWGPIFARLHERIDLLEMICDDTPDSELLSWIKPNPLLWSRCGRYMQRKKIGNRKGLVADLLKFAEKDQSLRKLIFFNWVEKNKQAMSFFSVKAEPETFLKLAQGEFGSAKKVRIIAEIEPRPGLQEKYGEILAGFSQKQDENLQESPEKKPQAEEVTPAASTGFINNLKHELKELQQLYNRRASEIAGLQNALSERDRKNDGLLREKAQLEELLQKFQSAALTSSADQVEDQQSAKQRENELGLTVFKLSQQVEALAKEKKELGERLARIESAMALVNDENRCLKEAINDQSDNNRKIETLKQLISNREQKNAKKKWSGQLLCLAEEHSNWYLSSFGGDLLAITAEKVREADACQFEFCCAYLDANEEIVNLESLEAEKQHKVGFIKIEGEDCFLCDGEKEYPIQVDLRLNDTTRPCRGIFLNEFNDRPAGIYELFPVNLPVESKLSEPTAQKRKDIKDAGQTAKLEEKFDFGGRKVLLVGGDYVANDYQRIFEQHNLKITNISGFSGAGQFRNGTQSFDLIAIILRQVSHTTLREMVKTAKKFQTPVIYCKKRGVSGLLQEFKAWFKL
ncbi:MAG: DUF2325 domain-containing protein [Candidatus Rifleibacteriota bacterium]